jgi:hypothetical protein
MSNKQKAFAAAVITFLAAIVRFVFNYELPAFALEILMTLAGILMGLFIKTPEEKKS